MHPAHAALLAVMGAGGLFIADARRRAETHARRAWVRAEQWAVGQQLERASELATAPLDLVAMREARLAMINAGLGVDKVLRGELVQKEIKLQQILNSQAACSFQNNEYKLKLKDQEKTAAALQEELNKTKEALQESQDNAQALIKSLERKQAETDALQKVVNGLKEDHERPRRALLSLSRSRIGSGSAARSSSSAGSKYGTADEGDESDDDAW